MHVHVQCIECWCTMYNVHVYTCTCIYGVQTTHSKEMAREREENKKAFDAALSEIWREERQKLKVTDTHASACNLHTYTVTVHCLNIHGVTCVYIYIHVYSTLAKKVERQPSHPYL